MPPERFSSRSRSNFHSVTHAFGSFITQIRFTRHCNLDDISAYCESEACPDSVTFTTLAPLEHKAAEVCSLCRQREAILEYDLQSDDPDFQSARGFCCVNCATSLLAAMENVQRARNEKVDDSLDPS